MLINELYFETQLIQSSGNGIVNLISKRIKIDMIGKIRKISDMKSSNNVYTDNYPRELVGKELPILIRGTLDNPDITIDMKDIIKKELIDPIKDKVNIEANLASKSAIEKLEKIGGSIQLKK